VTVETAFKRIFLLFDWKSLNLINIYTWISDCVSIRYPQMISETVYTAMDIRLHTIIDLKCLLKNISMEKNVFWSALISKSRERKKNTSHIFFMTYLPTSTANPALMRRIGFFPETSSLRGILNWCFTVCSALCAKYFSYLVPSSLLMGMAELNW